MNDFLAELRARLGNVEKNDVGKVHRREVDIDMLNAYRMISPESFWGIVFNVEMQKLMQKMWRNKPEQKMFLDKMKIKFCIQDNQDNSIARVMRADYASNVLNLDGDSFVVAFTKDKLLKLKNKDEAAFVMGHELSHLLYKRDMLDGYQDYAEETACDLNSLQLMADSGMNLESALSVDDIYEQKSEEMKTRREERAEFIRQLDQDNVPTMHDFSIYKAVEFVPLEYAFTMPEAKDTEEEKVDKIFKGLKEVFEVGGRAQYGNKLKQYLEQEGSKAASRQVLLAAAKIFSEFEAVDEVRKNLGSNKYFKHPICVLGDAVLYVNNMEGQKLFPQTAVKKIKEGLKQNPYYSNGMKFLWNKALGCEENLREGRDGR